MLKVPGVSASTRFLAVSVLGTRGNAALMARSTLLRTEWLWPLKFLCQEVGFGGHEVTRVQPYERDPCASPVCHTSSP